MTSDSENSSDENPYSAPESPSAQGMPDAALMGAPTVSNLEIEELRAFVGHNADRFLSKWYTALRGRSRPGFNWPAFLFAGIWLGYRKMYRLTAIFYGALALLTLVEELLVAFVFREAEGVEAFDRLVRLIVAIVCGVCANSWYLAHARRQIAEVRALQLDRELHLLALARRGGTNVAMSLGFFLCFAGVLFAMLFGLGILLHGLE